MTADKELLEIAESIERTAFSMSPPNAYTPQFVQFAQRLRAAAIQRIEATAPLSATAATSGPTFSELSAARWAITQMHRTDKWDNDDIKRVQEALGAVLRLAAAPAPALSAIAATSEFVSVPREPTEAMVKAGDRANTHWFGTDCLTPLEADIWKAMLAAAPAPAHSGDPWLFNSADPQHLATPTAPVVEAGAIKDLATFKELQAFRDEAVAIAGKRQMGYRLRLNGNVVNGDCADELVNLCGPYMKPGSQ